MSAAEPFPITVGQWLDLLGIEAPPDEHLVPHDAKVRVALAELHDRRERVRLVLEAKRTLGIGVDVFSLIAAPLELVIEHFVVFDDHARNLGSSEEEEAMVTEARNNFFKARTKFVDHVRELLVAEQCEP